MKLKRQYVNVRLFPPKIMNVVLCINSFNVYGRSMVVIIAYLSARSTAMKLKMYSGLVSAVISYVSCG